VGEHQDVVVDRVGRVNVTLPNRSSINMAFVSFHAIEAFPGLSPIPFS